MAWVRKANESEEIIMAADSCFTGGMRFLAAPKLFPAKRGDFAIACAGHTGYSFPIVEQIRLAFELNKRLQDRAIDLTDILHLIEDIANKCLHEEKEPEYATSGEGPAFSMIIAGFSWKKRKAILKIMDFDWKERKMIVSDSSTIKGIPFAIIGDEAGPCRGKIFNVLDRDFNEGKSLGLQPFDVLMAYINDPDIRHIGGYPQLLKIYPFMNILPFGFLHKIQEDSHSADNILLGADNDGNRSFITYFGRPLLRYETFPYPIINLATKEIQYMYQRTGDSDFVLTHESIKPLTGFKPLSN